MKLNEFLKSLNELEDIDSLEKSDIVKYNDEDIIDALMSEKPDVELKDVFGEDFWPKVERWLNIELKNTKVNDEESKIIGGSLRAKLDKYLDREEPEYENNAKTLARYLINSYQEWAEKEIKDKDLPHKKIG